jgi:hypothetical protein
MMLAVAQEQSCRDVTEIFLNEVTGDVGKETPMQLVPVKDTRFDPQWCLFRAYDVCAHRLHVLHYSKFDLNAARFYSRHLPPFLAFWLVQLRWRRLHLYRSLRGCRAQ